MSRHYLVMNQQGLDASSSVQDALAKLRAIDPATAKRLEQIDWVSLRACAAEEALKAVVESIPGASFQKTYQNSWGNEKASGKPPQGECLGVIALPSNWVQVGISMTADGTFSLFWNRYSEQHGSTLAELKAKIKAAYTKEALRTTLQVISGHTTESKQPDGTVVLQAALKGRG